MHQEWQQSHHLGMTACPDIIPAKLINNMIPSATALWKHDKQPWGECESINIYGSFRLLTQKWTTLASLTFCIAIIHCMRRELIQYLQTQSAVDCRYQAWFLKWEALFCDIYLVLLCRVKTGCAVQSCISCRWLEHLHYGVYLFLSSCLILHPTNF